MNQPWHMLVYIAADNALYADALVSLRQITDASLLSSVRITVQFDGPSAQSSSRYVCEGGKRQQTWVAPDDYSPDRKTRLRDFLYTSLPNNQNDERIFLVLWGHGAGLDHVYLYNDPEDIVPQSEEKKPLSVMANGGCSDTPVAEKARPAAFDVLNSDTAHANRYLKDIQLAEILGDCSRRIGRKIDLLGFDACLMGLAEICHEVSSSVSTIVASDEELPKGSWPYDSILEDLTQFPGMDASALSAIIVSRFLERYGKEGKRTRISLSAYRLSASEELATAMKGLVEAISAFRSGGTGIRKILLARDFSRTPEVTDYIDLGCFCKEIVGSFDEDSSIRHRAMEVLKILVSRPYILYHRDASETGGIRPMGLAIYFPQVLPPKMLDLDHAVGADGGHQIYRPLASQPRSHTWNTYRPQGDGVAMSVGGSSTKTVTSDTRKTLVANSSKTVPADRTKTPPTDARKNPDGGRIVHRELIGSEILWDQYVSLRFNKETGWADLVGKLLVRNKPESDPISADAAPSSPPNTENGAQ